VVVGVLYLSVAATSVLVLGPALGASQAPLADLLAAGVGGPVREITAVVAVLLTIGAVNAYLAGASRLGVALARDGALPARVVGTPRKSLAFVTAGGLLSVLLPFDFHTVMLLVTGCFTLVYVLGTAAAVRLLPTGWARVAAGFALAAVTGLLWLNGAPALLSLCFAAGGVAYYSWRNRAAKTATPASIRSGRTAPNPNTNPAVCLTES
jgi:amino acid efflux transporter